MAAPYIPKIFTNQVNSPKRYYYVNDKLKTAWSTTVRNVNAKEVTFDEHAFYCHVAGYKETYYK